MINMNDMMNNAKGMMDNADSEGEGNGLSGIMDIAKDFDMETIEKYKAMSKAELMEELKNSEHSAKVIELIKGFIAQKTGN